MNFPSNFLPNKKLKGYFCHWPVMDQEYFICGLSIWCFITKIMEKYTIQLSLSRIIFKKDVRVYRTNMNRPIQSLYYVESNTFNILRLL